MTEEGGGDHKAAPSAPWFPRASLVFIFTTVLGRRWGGGRTLSAQCQCWYQY